VRLHGISLKKVPDRPMAVLRFAPGSRSPKLARVTAKTARLPAVRRFIVVGRDDGAPASRAMNGVCGMSTVRLSTVKLALVKGTP